jgi:glycosyltransferase involved in cell wall biosynthesis
MQQRSRLDNLLLMDFQAYSDVAEMLGAADVLLGIIDDEAGSFAVPSKVLSYLCAGRPVLLAAPGSNLASRTVARAEAGLIANPGDADELIRAARRLAADPDLRRIFAENARRYAKSAFDIHTIGRRFEMVLAEAVQSHTREARGDAYAPAYPRVAAD